jgi:hypothetical protein
MDEVKDAPAPADRPDPVRRATLRRLGKFMAVTPPTLTLLLAASAKPKAAQAASVVFSSKQLKTSEGVIDETGVLDAVAALPVDRWRYKAETGLSQQLHIGPYAEDFKAFFGVGDGVTINTTDALGVCLAAIKALTARVATLEAELRQKSGEVP